MPGCPAERQAHYPHPRKSPALATPRPPLALPPKDQPDLAPGEEDPEFTSLPRLRRSSRRRKWLQVLLLSLSPWPRPRLSSCMSRRSRITSSWPGDTNCEPRSCNPPIPTQILGFGRRIPTTGPGGPSW